jgi:hypothetical protein
MAPLDKTTRLAKQIDARLVGAAKPPAEDELSKLGRFRALGSRGKLVTLPVLGPAWIELVSHDALNEIEGETWAEMERLRVPLAHVTSATFEADKTVRCLARAVRDPDDPTHAKPFGTVEEWVQLDSDLVAAINLAYLDVRAELDPVGIAGGEWGELSEDDRKAITSAVEKKNRMRLLSFGTVALSSYLLSMAAQREISPTNSSSIGDSSSES